MAMSKRDIYRLYKMLSAIRKSIFWQSVDAAQRLRHESHVRKFIQNLHGLQNLSANFLTLFIFAKTLLIALLELFQVVFTELPLGAASICIVVYFLFVMTSGIIYWTKRKRLSEKISNQENQILQEIRDLQEELRVIGLQDDMVTCLSEIKLLSELKEEYKKSRKSGAISTQEFEYEIESLEEASKGAKQRLEKIKAELRNVGSESE